MQSFIVSVCACVCACVHVLGSADAAASIRGNETEGLKFNQAALYLTCAVGEREGWGQGAGPLSPSAPLYKLLPHLTGNLLLAG